MNKYVLATNVGVVFILISCVGSSISAQPMTQSPNSSMSASTNTTTTSTNSGRLPVQIQATQCFVNGCATNMTLSLVPTCFGVCITSIETTPAFLQVNDTFGLGVAVTNNSPKTISYNDICLSPVTATFDNHVAVKHKVGCLAIGTFSIPPHTTHIVFGPASSLVYKAVLAGVAKSVVAFSYSNGSIKSTVYKPFYFLIWPAI